MTERDDGGPAFPALVRCFDNDTAQHFYSTEGGLSARDLFAAAALMALLADRPNDGANSAAVLAYCHADAMLEERAK